jgi:hypothetical protein
MTRASASYTSSRVIALPGRYTTSAYGSSTPFKKGICESHTIFIFVNQKPDFTKFAFLSRKTVVLRNFINQLSEGGTTGTSNTNLAPPWVYDVSR